MAPKEVGTLYRITFISCIYTEEHCFYALRLRGHRNEIFVLLNGFWPLRGGGGQHLAVNFCKISTKITLRKL